MFSRKAPDDCGQKNWSQVRVSSTIMKNERGVPPRAIEQHQAILHEMGRDSSDGADI